VSNEGTRVGSARRRRFWSLGQCKITAKFDRFPADSETPEKPIFLESPPTMVYS